MNRPTHCTDCGAPIAQSGVGGVRKLCPACAHRHRDDGHRPRRRTEKGLHQKRESARRCRQAWKNCPLPAYLVEIDIAHTLGTENTVCIKNLHGRPYIQARLSLDWAEVVWAHYYRRTPGASDTIIHHIDGNTQNADIKNLAGMGWGAHAL